MLTPTTSLVTADPGQRRRTAGPTSPFLVLMGVVAGGVLLVSSRYPLRDTDLPWHVLLGDEIRSGIPVALAGRGWSFAPVPDTWVTTQWLTEVGLSAVHEAGGWTGVLLLRLLSLAVALATLAVASLRHRASPAAMVPFVAGALTLLFYAQERSQQVTFVLAPLVGLVWLRAVRDGRLPPWWVVLPGVALWANLHGGWIIAPMALLAVAAGRWLDHGRHDRVALRALLLTALTLVGAALTPWGPAGVLKPFDFAAATSMISEWQRTVPTDMLALPFAALVLVVLAAWARGVLRPARSEVLWVLALVVFALTAVRNLPPAVLMLAAVASWRLALTWPGGRPATGTEARVLTAVASLAAALGLALGAVVAAGVDPLPDDIYPTALWQQVAGTAGPTRVLAADTQAGWLLLTSPPPGTTVAIDGRADRNGAAYIERFIAMRDGRPGWESLVAELDPDLALLQDDKALVALLQQAGWREVGRQAGYVLLAPPPQY